MSEKVLYELPETARELASRVSTVAEDPHSLLCMRASGFGDSACGTEVES